MACSVAEAGAGAWSFGVMTDTQSWDYSDPEVSPGSVEVEIIKQVNPRFIEAGVKLVIQVGDLTEDGSVEGIAVRAAAAQPLFDAGIGFFAIRGNHESSMEDAIAFQATYPQNQGVGDHVFGATNFDSPFPSLAGLSYSFDYRGARFVFVDQFYRTDGTLGTNIWAQSGIPDQIPWMSTRLTTKREGVPLAFVLGHEDLIGQAHTDTMFGDSPAADPDSQNSFISNLQTNGVRLYICGHDHMHNRSLIESPDGLHSVEQLICCSESTRFYVPQGSPLLPPGTIPNDLAYDFPPRETPIAQEGQHVGYYIFTIDGPKVTVDYYSSELPLINLGGVFFAPYVPTLHFTRRERFGYSLNGLEFAVPQAGPYTNVQQTIPPGNGYRGSTARILAGVNTSTTADAAGRPFTKMVDLGWAPGTAGVASDVLTLWGMVELGDMKSDVVALSLSYAEALIAEPWLSSGRFCLATRSASGRWVNAVDANSVGAKTFVMGPWRSSYPLGTYGVDTVSKTVWAVIDQEGEFVAVYLAPELTIGSVGHDTVLEWASDVQGYELQECADLAVGKWVPVSSAPVGNRFRFSAAVGGSRFFRLVGK